MQQMERKIKNIFLTGPPATGKSSLLVDVARELLLRGIKVRGVICPEIRRAGRRWGFKLKVFPDGDEYIMASVDINSPYRVSKYGVSVRVIDEVSDKILLRLLKDESLRVIIIDEIGKMELMSQKFRNAVIHILNSNKVVLGVLGRIRDPLVDNIKRRADTKIYTLDRETANKLRTLIKGQILELVFRALS